MLESNWRPVPGLEGYYEVHRSGAVRSVLRTTRNAQHKVVTHSAKLVKPRTVDGRECVRLQGVPRFADELVAAAFGTEA